MFGVTLVYILLSRRIEVSGRQSRGRPKKAWSDNIKEGMKKYQLREDMAHTIENTG